MVCNRLPYRQRNLHGNYFFHIEFTAKANGVVWGKCSKRNGQDRKAVVIYGGEVKALNTDFEIKREDKAKYKLTNDSIEVTCSQVIYIRIQIQ